MGKVSIHGLKDLSYIDKTLDGAPTLKEDREAVTLSSWTDRVYLSAPNNLSIQGAGSSGGKLSLSKTNLADCVVWNPWAEKAAGMGDLGAENWEGFVCVCHTHHSGAGTAVDSQSQAAVLALMSYSSLGFDTLIRNLHFNTFLWNIFMNLTKRNSKLYLASHYIKDEDLC